MLARAAMALFLGFAQIAVPAAPARAQAIAATVRGDPAAYAAERERLFRYLRQAGSEAEGRAIEYEIWLLWLEAPDAGSARLMNRALERRRMIDLAGARAILDELVARAPDWAEAWNQRATVLFEQGHLERSLADVERTLALEPKHFGALAGQAMILMRQGRMRAAQSILRRAVEIHPFLAERAMLLPVPGERPPQPGERRL